MKENNMKKIAVVFFNLGGPDKIDSIKPFLFNFFMDKNIIAAPKFIRFLLAKYISSKRSKGEALKSYSRIGGKSPLLENSIKQIEAVENILNKNSDYEFKNFICMRYWNPRASEVVKQVEEYNPDKIILVPLYPQFSATTSGSSFEEWKEAIKGSFLENIKYCFICCYPDNSGFIDSSAKLIRKEYIKAKKEADEKGWKKPRILFSAHGLPKSFVKNGDPYKYQCEETVRKIVERLGIADIDYKRCYQSRVGPMKWIEPSTREVIKEAGEDNIPIVIYPHAFVNEHVETLVEIEEQYREIAINSGCPAFYRVNTVSVDDYFIKGLADIIKSKINFEGICSYEEKRICSSRYSKCAMNEVGN